MGTALETCTAESVVTSQYTKSLGAATAVDCTTSRARAKTPSNAVLKSYDGTIGQTNVVRQTQATSLPPTDPHRPNPFDELFVDEDISSVKPLPSSTCERY